MQLETIFRAALHDMHNGKAQPHCGEPARLDEEWPLSDVAYAAEYAEPGYDNSRKGVLFANWNHYPTRLTDILERAGYAIEWSAEWTTCDDCQRALRTSPDSYSWLPSQRTNDNGETFCKECLLSDLDTYEAELLNNPRIADTFDVDWEARGFKKLNEHHYESGFHHGQDDDPVEIAKTVPKGHDFLFTIPMKGQFDISFDCWIRPQEQEEQDQDA